VSQLKILGKTYKVEIVEPDSLNHNPNLGTVTTVNNIISINANQAEENKAEVLLHEVIHAISDSVKLDLTEQQVTALASCLYGFFNDNDMAVNFGSVLQREQ